MPHGLTIGSNFDAILIVTARTGGRYGRADELAIERLGAVDAIESTVFGLVPMVGHVVPLDVIAGREVQWASYQG